MAGSQRYKIFEKPRLAYRKGSECFGDNHTGVKLIHESNLKNYEGSFEDDVKIRTFSSISDFLDSVPYLFTPGKTFEKYGKIAKELEGKDAKGSLWPSYEQVLDAAKYIARKRFENNETRNRARLVGIDEFIPDMSEIVHELFTKRNIADAVDFSVPNSLLYQFTRTGKIFYREGSLEELTAKALEQENLTKICRHDDAYTCRMQDLQEEGYRTPTFTELFDLINKEVDNIYSQRSIDEELQGNDPFTHLLHRYNRRLWLADTFTMQPDGHAWLTLDSLLMRNLTVEDKNKGRYALLEGNPELGTWGYVFKEEELNLEAHKGDSSLKDGQRLHLTPQDLQDIHGKGLVKRKGKWEPENSVVEKVYGFLGRGRDLHKLGQAVEETTAKFRDIEKGVKHGLKKESDGFKPRRVNDHCMLFGVPVYTRMNDYIVHPLILHPRGLFSITSQRREMEWAASNFTRLVGIKSQ